MPTRLPVLRPQRGIALLEHPLFYHAAYRAIDLSLIHIDAKSHAEDRDALDAYSIEHQIIAFTD
jgi:hypothetical protein